jgi:hypothetical protein
VLCQAQSCSDGKEQIAATCDGKGNCGVAGSPGGHLCAPYACGPLMCLTSCSSDADCASGASCNVGTHTCETGATCVDGSVLKSPTGDLHDCSPYVCAGTSCKMSCTSVDDCQAGFVCSATGECISLPTTSSPSGCAVAPAPANETRGLALAALAALACAAERRRRRRQLSGAASGGR